MHSPITLIVAGLCMLVCFGADAEDIAKSANGWPGAPYSRVVGYAFVRDPDTKWAEFTLLSNGKLDEALLKKVKTKEVVLNAEQTQRLLKATFGYDRPTRGAACYEPHHIFVFYDPNSRPVSAIEVCFSCRWIQSTPFKEVKGNDYATLAKLSWELGLGLGSPKNTLDWYLDQQKKYW
jgi:hypothetical protein